MADEEVATQGELAITRTGDRLRLAREAAGLVARRCRDADADHPAPSWLQ
jgi:hypothetical protein